MKVDLTVFSLCAGNLKLFIRRDSMDLFIYTRRDKRPSDTWFRPQPGEVVIDCGAYLGMMAMWAGKKGCNVIAFEPNPDSFSLLRQNLEINCLTKNVQIYNLGLGDEVSQLDLLVPDSLAGLSSFEESWTDSCVRGASRDGGKTFKVSVSRLDDILQDIVVIDWLLIDVESFELRVLKGAQNTLKKTLRVIIEISKNNNQEILDIMQLQGFNLTAIGPEFTMTRYYLFSRHNE